MPDTIKEAVTDALVCLMIAGAAFGAGYMTRALTQRAEATAKAATAEATAVKAAAQTAAKAESQILITTDRAARAAQEAHHAIDAVPAHAPQPGCDDSPVIDAWRGGLERVRAAADAGAGDDSAGGAAAVPVARPGGGQNGE